ncbi:hypothetical protein C8J57DRAFT_1661773 [Mycena rebaudengoi]|nr:hypothetical protein C8J57DRAFT_1661773 [Mycena rebaudengoi]
MSLSMSETSLSFLSSILPNNAANTIIGASALTAATAFGIHHVSPARLTRVLVTLMHETDTMHIRAVEAGLVFSDVDPDALFKLQIKVSELHEESLRNSLSTWKMLAEFFRGRSLVLYQCIRDVQDLKTRIEISKEEQLRNLNPTGSGTAAWAMSFFLSPALDGLVVVIFAAYFVFVLFASFSFGARILFHVAN